MDVSDNCQIHSQIQIIAGLERFVESECPLSVVECFVQILLTPLSIGNAQETVRDSSLIAVGIVLSDAQYSGVVFQGLVELLSILMSDSKLSKG